MSFKVNAGGDEVDRSTEHASDLDFDIFGDRLISRPLSQSHFTNGDFDAEPFKINGDDLHSVFG